MFSVFLFVPVFFAVLLGPASAMASAEKGQTLPFRTMPVPEDLEISSEEDRGFLEAVLKSIFPDGTGGLTDEQKGIAILRYAASALELKNNGGSATKIIKEGYAICGGLSHVHRVLCRMVGLPSRYIGAFNLRPIMGSHAISEVYYDGKWHLLDPTFGLFFYSREAYDGTGEIASFHDLVMSADRWTAFKVVEQPWIGRYDAAVRSHGVAAVEADYLKDRYKTPIMDLYRKYLAETFPIAYGHNDPVSYPVDADLRDREEMRIGEVDGNYGDVLRMVTNGSVYVGSHYLGGSYPPGFHTWSIRTPGPCRLRIEYFSTHDNPPVLKPSPLKAARIVSVGSEGKKVVLELQAIGPEVIVSVYCPDGTFSVDAVRAARVR
ncbi:MAG: transglutaminase domain-containing protein [Candidatus Latescibacteria bacterium]|nr:transglutaminase domain-containing protein [Candidatus Latescibacterota bacterium]